jgi:hypothetical protein
MSWLIVASLAFIWGMLGYAAVMLTDDLIVIAVWGPWNWEFGKWADGRVGLDRQPVDIMLAAFLGPLAFLVAGLFYLSNFVLRRPHYYWFPAWDFANRRLLNNEREL